MCITVPWRRMRTTGSSFWETRLCGKDQRRFARLSEGRTRGESRLMYIGRANRVKKDFR
jgi:hypothetical protein